MKKIKPLLIFFISVFICSSCLFSITVTRPNSLKEYNGDPIKKVAISQLDVKEGKKYWTFCGYDSSVPWCACFVSWCASQCFDQAPVISSCSEYADWFISRRCMYDRNIVPLAGMVIFLDWNGDNTPDHMGITDKVSDDTVYTIEGNISGQCGRGAYDLKSDVILYYGAFVIK